MPTVDLATTPLRELNAALHRLTPDTNKTYWRLLNPRGQHSVAAGIDVPITVKIEDMHGQAMATITDTGIGIPADEIPHLFDKFYRVGEVAAHYEGTGLGLSIVKSVVETYNGRVWVESNPGKGSSFTIMLPAV